MQLSPTCSAYRLLKRGRILSYIFCPISSVPFYMSASNYSLLLHCNTPPLRLSVGLNPHLDLFRASLSSSNYGDPSSASMLGRDPLSEVCNSIKSCGMVCLSQLSLFTPAMSNIMLAPVISRRQNSSFLDMIHSTIEQSFQHNECTLPNGYVKLVPQKLTIAQ